MSISSVGVHAYDADQCRAILSNLPDIFAAGLRFDDDQLVEIHVLASIERSPKQISRDIQSALFATYGIEVDHRIISIAQLPEDPFRHVIEADTVSSETSSVREVRLLFTGIDSSQKNGIFEASVYLSCDTKSCTGTARCRNTEMQRNRAVANATLEAVNELLGSEYFTLMEVKQVNISEVSITLSVIEYQGNNMSAPIILIGAAVQQDNTPASIVRSTLDALNRSFGKLYHTQSETK